MGKELGKAVVKKIPKGAGGKTLKAETKRNVCLSASIDGQPAYGWMTQQYFKHIRTSAYVFGFFIY